MTQTERFEENDRAGVDALYRRVFGHDAADASRLRWDWQYAGNPSNTGGVPEIWVARDGAAIVGQYATMPVRLWVCGRDVHASWGMDVMVAPERQRRGLGEMLFNVWDRHVDVSLGLGLSEASHRLFRKLQWPDVGPVPCFVKPLTPRGLRQPHWPEPINRIVALAAAPLLGWSQGGAGADPSLARIARFDETATALWERAARTFDFAVRRDATYLNWKFVAPPHVRYSIVTLAGKEAIDGYAIFRHTPEPRGRVTLLVDFLADPNEPSALRRLLAYVETEARRAASDKIRCFATHADYRRALRRAGFFEVRSTMDFVVKVNAFEPPPGFYERRDRWHVTLGDSDQDR